ncbi:MAG: hypothetical protein ACI4NP_02615 [Thermoguttaceae bacterium]
MFVKSEYEKIREEFIEQDRKFRDFMIYQKFGEAKRSTFEMFKTLEKMKGIAKSAYRELDFESFELIYSDVERFSDRLDTCLRYVVEGLLDKLRDVQD